MSHDGTQRAGLDRELIVGCDETGEPEVAEGRDAFDERRLAAGDNRQRVTLGTRRDPRGLLEGVEVEHEVAVDVEHLNPWRTALSKELTRVGAQRLLRDAQRVGRRVSQRYRQSWRRDDAEVGGNRLEFVGHAHATTECKVGEADAAVRELSGQ